MFCRVGINRGTMAVVESSPVRIECPRLRPHVYVRTMQDPSVHLFIYVCEGMCLGVIVCFLRHPSVTCIYPSWIWSLCLFGITN